MELSHVNPWLRPAVKRLRLLGFFNRLAVAWWSAAVMAVLGLAVILIMGGTAVSAVLWVLVPATAVLTVWAGFRRRPLPWRRHTARQIEKTYPDLRHRLLAAIEQQPDPETGKFSLLQRELLVSVAQHAQTNDWCAIVPRRNLLRSALACMSGGIALTSALLALWLVPSRFHPDAAGNLPILSDHSAAVDTSVPIEVLVEPGDIEIERGASLAVVARFPKHIPSSVVLRTESPAGEAQRREMVRHLDDGAFAIRLASIAESFAYHVEFDGRQAGPFTVSVFDLPRVERIDARVEYPSWTGRAAETVEDTNDVAVVDGGRVTFTIRTNKRLRTARLVADDGTIVTLATDDEAPCRFVAAMSPKQSVTYTVELEDAAGRRNRERPTIALSVVPNLRPQLAIEFPARDLDVSPLEEITIEGVISDDFGIRRYGLEFTIVGRPKQRILLGDRLPAAQIRRISHTLALEELDVQPDDLLSYCLFAEDVGPDGRVRVTRGDLFFAEVRPFEEIYRQAPQPPGGGGAGQSGAGGNQKKLDELIRLQKAVVSATWNLIRQTDAASELNESTRGDVRTVAESQRTALEQTTALASKSSDPTRTGLVNAVVEAMSRAAAHFTRSIDDRSALPLADALADAQTAYRALLRLRARETLVARGQASGGGQGGGSGRSSQTLNQLELKQDDSRYETARNAASNQATSEAAENLSLLNRLRELARRQNDLNRKLRELQAELRLAKTEAEREELNRRLKRLREQQREILRDVDQLRNRMDRSGRSTALAEERAKLEQARSRIRRVSQSLEENRLGQALAEGTRAGNELTNLRDAFRKRSAGQFADAMRSLRHEARKLEDEQNRLRRLLQQNEGTGRKRLRPSTDREAVASGLDRQRQRLSRLLDQMRDLVHKAETAEPALSRRLYETLRQTARDRPDEALEAASKHLRRGERDAATQNEARASRGIAQIRRGIEQAAEGILGDELESLKLARQSIEEATRSLDRELENLIPQQSRDRPSAQDGANSDRRSETGSAARRSPGRPAERSDSGSATSRTADRTPASTAEKPSPSTPMRHTAEPGQRKSAPGSVAEGPMRRRSSDASGRPSSPSTQPGEGAQPESQTASASSGEKSGSQTGPSSRSAGSRNAQSTASGESEDGGTRGRRGPSFMQRGGLAGGPGGPLTGDGFSNWADRLREVEELVDDPDLRAEVTRIRERARSLRAEFKRHSREPRWELVKQGVLDPLTEVAQRLDEEIARRQSTRPTVPIDRDPVPPRFTELVRRYYEQLGRGE